MLLRRSLLFTTLALLGLLIGSELAVFRAPTREHCFGEDLRSAVMSPDGKWVAAVGMEESGHWFFEIWSKDGKRSGERVEILPPSGRFQPMCWREDGREVAVGLGAEVWLFTPGESGRRVLAAAKQVRGLEYRSQTLMARCDTTTLCWNVRSRKQILRLDQNHLLHAALDPQGKRLITSCFEDGIRIFDLGRKRQLLHITPGVTVSGLQITKGGHWITASYRRHDNRRLDSIQTFTLQNGERVAPPLATPVLEGFQATPDGSRLVARCQEKAVVFDLPKGKPLAENKGSARLIDQITNDGKRIATAPQGAGRPNALLWDAKGNAEHSLGDTAQPFSLSWSETGRLIVVDGRISVWRP